MSSSTGIPSAPTATGTRSRAAPVERSQRVAGFVPVQVGDAEQGGEFDVGVQRLGGVRREAHPVRREQPGQRFRGGRAHGVGAAEEGGLLLAAAVGAYEVQGVRLHVEAQGGAAGAPAEGAGQVEHDDVAKSGAVQAVSGGHGGAVDDDHGERFVAAGHGLGVEDGPLGEFGAEQLLQVAEGGGDQPGGAGAVLLLGVLAVREPLDPFPFGAPVVGDAQGDPQLLRRVEEGELGQDRADGVPYGPLVAAEQDPGPGPQVEAGGLVGDDSVRLDEAAQRVGAERFEVLDRFGRRRGEAQRELLVADGYAYLGEVVVGDPALPQPGGTHHGAQHPGLGVPPGEGLLLVADRLVDAAPDLRQIAQVVASFAAQPLFALAALAHHLADEHGGGGGDHHAECQVGEHTAAAARTHEHQHHGHRHHGHREIGPDRRGVRNRLRQGRWLLEVQLSFGHVRAATAGWAAEEDHTQRTDSFDDGDGRPRTAADRPP